MSPSEVEDYTTETIESGINRVVSKESESQEEGLLISQRQIMSSLNQPDHHTPLLGESQGNEANNPIGENDHQTICSYQSLLQEPSCFPTSQHEQMASLTSEIKHGIPSNFFVSENGQNNVDKQQREEGYNDEGQEKEKEGTQDANLIYRNVTPVATANESEDYNFDGTDNNPVSHHSNYHSQNQESEQVTIAEQQISPQQLANLSADALSDSYQDNSSYDERDGSLSDKQVEEKGKRRRSDISLEDIESLFGMKEDEAAMALRVSVPTIKRRCRELGITRWPKKSLSLHHSAKKRKVSKSPSNSGYSQHETAREHLNGAKAKPIRMSNSAQQSRSSGSFVVKATYKENTVRFISSSTAIGEIKEEVADNLELDRGKKFKIKYEDSDKEWLLMTKNEHFEYARSLSGSSGGNVLRLFIFDS